MHNRIPQIAGITTVRVMTDMAELYHIALHTAEGEIDLTAPARAPVGALLPTALDLMTDAGLLPQDLSGRQIALAIPGLDPLDEQLSFAEQGIHDGSLLTLVPIEGNSRRCHFDEVTTICEQSQSMVHKWSPADSTRATVLTTIWLAALCAGLLIHSVQQQLSMQILAVGGAGCLLAIAFAVLARRRQQAQSVICAAGIAATIFASTTAALSLPIQPWTSSAMLAMAACSVTAMGMARLLRCGTRVFTAIAGISAVVAISFFGEVSGWWPIQAIGPILVLGSQTLLATAPRIAIRGSSPSIDSDNDPRRTAANTYNRLSDLLLAAGTLTTVGSIFTITTARSIPLATATVLLTSIHLLLHANRYADIRRAAPLSGCAAISVTATLWALAAANPAFTPWICIGITAVLGIWCSVCRSMPHRILRTFEYVATASVIPLSCWATGLFSAARGVSFT